MRRAPSVDVAGGHLGDLDLAVTDRRLDPVITPAPNPFEGAGATGIEGEHLATVLSIHPHEALGLLDHAVRLGGDDEAIVGDPDEQPLTTASQRK